MASAVAHRLCGQLAVKIRLGTSVNRNLRIASPKSSTVYSEEKTIAPVSQCCGLGYPPLSSLVAGYHGAVALGILLCLLSLQDITVLWPELRQDAWNQSLPSIRRYPSKVTLKVLYNGRDASNTASAC
eukprot:scaffold11713_cov19-Tisochrysis_lutea.AAC.1